MSVAATVTALQTLHATIAGIKSAPTSMPSNLATAQLPIALVWPGEAEWQLAAMGLKRQERTYIVRVFAQPVGQNVSGPETGYTACVTMLELFGQAYQDNLTLAGAVDHIDAVRDSGISGGSIELTWGNTTYWGFVFRVQIEEKE